MCPPPSGRIGGWKDVHVSVCRGKLSARCAFLPVTQKHTSKTTNQNIKFDAHMLCMRCCVVVLLFVAVCHDDMIMAAHTCTAERSHVCLWYLLRVEKQRSCSIYTLQIHPNSILEEVCV